ncbi:MAG: type VI secretion system tip protein VgrG [Nannocystaceae bacterium]|nr:type VI secretion system tip protein VgrG [Nannocystaceae bacterium]
MTLEPVSVAVLLRTTEGAELDLSTRRFELVERIDHPYEATAELVSEDLDLDVRSLLGARATVELDRPGVTARALGGVVTRSEYVTTRNRQLTVRVVVEPSLALLRYSIRRRVFADLTLPEVLEAVAGPAFASHGGAWEFSPISTELEPEDYRVQWGESDLDFVLRLLSEAGLCLLHGVGDDETQTLYVLTDANAALPGVGMDASLRAESKPWPVSFEPEAEEQADEPSVQYLGRWDGMHAQGTSVTARNWKDAGATRFETRIELGDEPGRQGHMWRHHPARLDEGKNSDSAHVNNTEAWATRLLEEQRAGGTQVSGSSNIADLAAGATFELQGHPHVDLDQGYAVLSVVHQADFPEVDLDAHGQDRLPTYTNRFVAAPLNASPVRPPLRPKPRASGIESATVVGPQGEEVHTDALGRVQVRFHWDDAPSQTCWLRVISPWAGPGYGASFIPRVGMEVVVGFLGSDPDRPVVTGCLYTGTNMPPGALPQSKTCTVLRTQSSPGGEGFNELRFEDAAGSEEVFLHAQRNQRTVVKAAQSTQVGATRSLSVGRDSTRTIGGNETVRIGGEGEETGSLEVLVTGGECRTVFEGHELTADSALWRMATTLNVDAGEEVRMSCAETGSVLTMTPRTTTLEALESIKLRVGSAELELTPRGVFINGPVFTATPTEHAEVSSPGGSLTLREEDATLQGGTNQESSMLLCAERLHCSAKGELRNEGKSVTVHGMDKARLVSKVTKVEGTAEVSMTSNGEVSVVGDGETVIRGSKVRIN